MNFYNFDNNTEDNFYDKNFSEIDNTSEIVNDVLQNNNETLLVDKQKLTHNDCILIYLNPNLTSKSKFKNASMHIKNCDTCKKEISKKKIIFKKPQL